MPELHPDDSTPTHSRAVVVFAVLAFVAALRLAHLSSALHSPLSYQPGPDEDYYQRFGEAVAVNHGQDAPEFTFMDPGYGYLLGLVFRLIGPNPVSVYLLQLLLDTATAYGILVIGRLLGRPRAGVYGALLYGATATAILFSAALLKESCVAAFLTWWVVAALALMRTDRLLPWLLFGAFCGLGVALRSTLLAVGCVAVLLPAVASRHVWPAKAGLAFLGLAIALLPWSLRNHAAFGSLSPLPHNGGIVLHQAYNARNPQSALWIPDFVNYSHPTEIWRGYDSRAKALAGHALTPPQVDRYWRGQALEFMAEHPGQVMNDIGRKGLMFLAATEVPNNRSSAEERLFSPVLAWLPAPAPWLLGMGLAGLVWLAVADRRWMVVGVPILIAWSTMAVFWAEDRFRFHAMPLLALCSGIWLDGTARGVARLRVRSSESPWQWPAFGVLAAAIVGASFLVGSRFPPPPIRWDHVVWGFIKMGRLQEARTLAARVSREQPDNEAMQEALGYLAATGRDYAAAVQYFERAVALRPRSSVAHFNLAKAWLGVGDRTKAAAEATLARSLDPTPESEALLREIAATP